MFVFPIGVYSQKKSLPWVTIAIAAILGVGQLSLLAQGPDPLENQAEAQQEFFEILDYWLARPYLQGHPEMTSRFLPDSIPRLIQVSADSVPTPANPELLEYEQQTLSGMCERFLQKYSRRTRESLMLVPARGLAQPGWITHIILHGNWLHLIGNLWFLFLVAPTIERHWGPLWLLLLFFVGGVGGGIAQALADPGSWVPILGASGAIAACIGAFTIAFSHARVRFFYWILIAVGTFPVPAGIAGALWVSGEAYAFGRDGLDGGVATLCHLGGFAVGALVGWGLRLLHGEPDQGG